MAVPVPMADWSVVHNPAAATQATVTRAAKAAPTSPPNSSFSPSIVVKSISVSIAANASAQTPIHAYLRDGTTGAGTIVWSGILGAAVNGFASIVASDLDIQIRSGNATLEFEGAGVAGSVQSVSMTGRDLDYGGV